MITATTIQQDMLEGCARVGSAALTESLQRQLAGQPHGDLDRWLETLAQMPAIRAQHLEFNRDIVSIGDVSDASETQLVQLREQLMSLHPWRKGPFSLFGIHIDTEWRSDWKWSRVQPALAPLSGRRVLDVGSGNGYYCLRLLGEGAEACLGIDPTQLFNMQFYAVKQYCMDIPAYVIPLGIEHMANSGCQFDTILSMGVLYHRRSPLDHLIELRECLRTGGQLILETLVIEGDQRQVLLPQDRYAKMRNVWFIPSTDALYLWLQRCGYRDIELVDVTQTRVEEQRSTEWMRFESLADYLDPRDASRTIEGYPAPRRALFTANR